MVARASVRLRFAVRPDVLKRARGPEARADTSVVVRTHLIIRVVDRGTEREAERKPKQPKPKPDIGAA